MLSSRTLERELSAAVSLDRDRRLIDDTKKKAICTSATYDEFKARVACATLTPLRREDFSQRSEVTRNRMFMGGHSNNDKSATTAAASSGSIVPAAQRRPASIANASDFSREWRRLPQDVSLRMAFLENISSSAGGITIETLFRRDIDALLLDSMLSVCYNALVVDTVACKQHAATTFAVLDGLSHSSGLPMALAMQTTAEASRTSQLFSRLTELAEAEGLSGPEHTMALATLRARFASGKSTT